MRMQEKVACNPTGPFLWFPSQICRDRLHYQFLIVGGFYSEVALQNQKTEGTVYTKHQELKPANYRLFCFVTQLWNRPTFPVTCLQSTPFSVSNSRAARPIRRNKRNIAAISCTKLRHSAVSKL